MAAVSNDYSTDKAKCIGCGYALAPCVRLCEAGAV